MKSIIGLATLGGLLIAISMAVSSLSEFAMAHHYPMIGGILITGWIYIFGLAIGFGIGLTHHNPHREKALLECADCLDVLHDFATELDDLDNVPEYHYDCEALRKRLWDTASRAARRIKENHNKYHPEEIECEEST